MTMVIKTDESVSTLILATYDTSSEMLKEVKDEDLYIPVAALRRVIKRYYLIGELIYENNLKISISTTTPGYTCKVAIGLSSPRYSDFDEYTYTMSTTYKNAKYSYLNALPVDIYIESTDLSYSDVELDIDLEVFTESQGAA